MAGLLEPKWTVTRIGLVNKEAVKPKEPREGSVLFGKKESESGEGVSESVMGG